MDLYGPTALIGGLQVSTYCPAFRTPAERSKVFITLLPHRRLLRFVRSICQSLTNSFYVGLSGSNYHYFVGIIDT